MELYVFDHKMNELKIVLTENEVISAKETKEINKAGELDLCLPVKAYNFQDTDMVLVHTGYDNKYHVYVVVSTSLQGDELNVKATEYAYRLMDADGIIHDQRPNDMSVRDVLQHVIIDNGHEGIAGWSVGYVSDDLPRFTGNFYRENRLSALSKLAKACNVEFDFVFTMAGNKIDKRLIEAYDEIGVDTGKRYEYGDNLLSITAETDASGVYTRAYGFGKGEETDSGGFGRRLDFADIEWKKSEGAPIDKPIGWDYLVDTRGNWQDYQLDNGTDPSTVFTFEDCGVEKPDDPNSVREAKEKLLWLTWNALQEVNRPKVQFKANIGNAGELNLGDRVQIVRSDADIQYTTRVFKTVRDLITPALTTVELGDKVGTTTGEMVQNIQNQIKDTQESITNIQNNISFIENNTGNTIYYGEEMPPGDKHKEGDTWFEQHELPGGGMQTTIHVWDGEKWVTTYDPAIFEEAKQAAQDALKKAEESVAKVDKAVADFEASKVEVDNRIDSLDKEVDDRLNGVATKDDVETVRTELNGAIQDKVSNSEFESTRTQLEDAIQDKVSNEEFQNTTTQLANASKETIEKLNGLTVGAVNMFHETQNMWQLRWLENGAETLSTTDADWQKFNWTSDDHSTAEVYPVQDQWMTLEQDVEYTIQIRIKTDGELKECIHDFLYRWTHNKVAASLKKVADNEWIAYATYKGDGREYRMLLVTGLKIEGGTYVSFKEPQLERSSIPSAWSPNPDDFPSSEEFLEITKSVDGMQVQVSDLKKDTESQLNVLDEAIQATVSKIGASYPNGNMDDSNYSKYYDNFVGASIKPSPSKLYVVMEAEAGQVCEAIRKEYEFTNLTPGNILAFKLPMWRSGDCKVVLLANFKDADDNEVQYEVTESDRKFGNYKHWSWGACPISPTNPNAWEDRTVEFTIPQGAVKAKIGWRLEANQGVGASVRFKGAKSYGWTPQAEYIDDWNDLVFNQTYLDGFNVTGKVFMAGDGSKNNALVLERGENADKTVAMTKDYIKISSTLDKPKEELEDVKVKFKSKLVYDDASKVEGKLYIHHYGDDKREITSDEYFVKYDRSDVWYDNDITLNMRLETRYLKFEWVYWHHNAENYSLAIDDVVLFDGTSTISSQISMSTDNINMAVKGENLINQINISPEGINIDGSKLHITADTYIDKAVIDSANIKEINGDKVNVVNIRAQNIVGDTTEFVKSAWNSINGRINIDGDAIRIYNYSNNEHIDFSNGSLKFCNDTGYEICGMSRFGDGQVRLAINNGYHFYLMHRPDGWAEGDYAEIIGFDGRDGHMRVPNGRKLYMGSAGSNIMFSEQGLQGVGDIAMIMNQERAAGIGFAGSGIVIIKDGSYQWL